MLLPNELEVLVVESQPTMRAQLRTMLASVGIETAQYAVSATAAIKRLREHRYDLILCEYNLGEGQDGQHLLEDLHAHGIIPLDTVFVMITAERNYERVTSACELSPNDYILKPLNAETLRVRLLRAFQKRDIFLPAWQLMRLGDPIGAIEYCRIARDENPQHLTDLMRLQAQLHAGIGQLDEAETLHREILGSRSIPWAELGLARILVLKKRYVEAEGILVDLLVRHDRFIAAYELLARVYEETGRPDEACATLNTAAEKSPHRMARLRRLGTLSLTIGNPAGAEAALTEVVRKGKYSEFRDPEDHVRLVQAQLALDKVEDAQDTITDLDRSMGRQPKGEVCKAVCAALVHAHNDDRTRAQKALNAAVQAGGAVRELSVELRQDLIKACFDQEMQEQASNLVTDLLRSAADERTIETTRAVLGERGLGQLSQEIEARVQAEVKSLVTTGAEKARSGDFDGAVAEMMSAARKLPGNPHVLFNAALALLRHIENRGWNDAFATQAHGLIQRAQRLSPTSPRLAAITEFMHTLIKRYGIRPEKLITRIVRSS
ncbi:tetratricopeptide repeat-containing response regulator [Thauera linaloolentis]|uniref:AraC family transcriptional regulator n=1 Tax=Thauera linaloolentis (strain DSM 12138 / JCM 21573 / CCUG 41526 / CIP 105981 / IAM 15112 / NBRC 102519 / 47Lol) TaxID=1123367 RepID=N6YE04_THAL4|nr:tetratricopeptide repeat-containing response regulator [Thauera linaloolentis]ENO89760.1 AraC family transcriptional regulator [Thauera linaloolentis 47Lol = DSM 12138]MCM8566058.1 response regulator [Thauera linaloolentis]